MNNLFLHIAYIFLALPFLLKDILYIRYCLQFAFICFILWSFANNMKSSTTVIWNSAFLGINSFLILVELKQNNWKLLPTNPFKNIGDVYNITKK